MCWNKEISFITLAVGTLFNIILWFSTTNWNVRIVAILWQYVLLMQLFVGRFERNACNECQDNSNHQNGMDGCGTGIGKHNWVNHGFGSPV